MAITRADLAALPLFSDASPAALDAMEHCAAEVRYASGDVLFRAGTPPRGWYVVLDGLVRVVRESGGRQHVVHSERRGGTLGEVPLFAGDTHPATGIAAEPTRCALFERKSLESAIAECPEIGLLINRRLALRVRHLVARLDERSRSVRVRLAEFLLERLASSRTGDRISLGMTQRALAEELGTVREVAARELKSLVAQNAIESLGGGRYRIANPAVLREITDAR